MKWEYKIVALISSDGSVSLGGTSNEDELNALGKEGWELVGITPERETVYATAYLKRSLE